MNSLYSKQGEYVASVLGLNRSIDQRMSAGFALPTILIASIVMLMVLLVSVTSVATVRTSLKSQYYEQLAQAAGEAGVAYAEACLTANQGIPQWTNAAPLKPNTDCSGVELVSCPTTSTNALCSVTKNGNIRSSFSIGLPPVEAPSALVVAGGGSGGGATGGGGGAGGVVYAPSTSVAVGPYTVVVGGGGTAPGNQLPGISGADSSFNGIVAKGGGGGGHSVTTPSGSAGKDGGSGGGGQTYYSSFKPGTGLVGQGNNGGTLPGVAGTTGGGGAGAAGGNSGTANQGGVGGVGKSYSITGAAVFYGGGGGGGGNNGIGGAGGAGGGGNGANFGGPTGGIGSPSAANTGGGGGGGWDYAGGNGGAGGSGVVVISYPTATMTASGGTVTNFGDRTIHRFTTVGNNTFTVGSISNTLKTIPNTGFVEILRNSNSSVWRTYQQKSTPSTTVPDLCSGETKSIYGWNSAVLSNASVSFPVAAAAPISIGPGGLFDPGMTFYRKDFSITDAGSYTLQARGDNYVDVYLDGRMVLNVTSSGATGSVSTALAAGCHTVVAKVKNGGVAQNDANLTFALTKAGTTNATVLSDTSWRVSAGNSYQFSHINYAQSASWQAVRDMGAYNMSPWSAITGWTDVSARWINTNHSYSGTNYPYANWAFFRDQRESAWTMASPTQVKISAACDNSCVIYVDGNEVMTVPDWTTTYSSVLTLSEGRHEIGVALNNTGATDNSSGLLLSVARTSDNAVIARSDASWVAGNTWFSSNINPTSYDDTFLSTPREYECSCDNVGTTNEALNPSAESDSVGFAVANGSTVTRGAGYAIVGSQGIRVSAPASGIADSGASVPITTTLVPGEKVTVSAYIRSTTAGSYRLSVQGTSLASSSTAAIALGANSSGRVSATVTASKVGSLIGYVLRPSALASSVVDFDIDGIMLTHGSTLFPYADGSSTLWSWLGTANNSVSSGSF